MYMAALLATVYYLAAERSLAGMVAFGLAWSLKPQAIFLVPFLGGWFFRQGMPWRWVALPPLVYVICGLPAVLAGKPILEVLFHWGRQKNFPVLTLGATNWYQWISNDQYGVFFQAGVVLTLVATVFIVLAMQMPHRDRLAFHFHAALLSVLVVPYFLPGMHERYFFAADIFALVYAFLAARGWVVAVLVQFCSFFTYLPDLFQREPVSRQLLALVMTIALGVVATAFARPCFRGAEAQAIP
jgi:Gpi18-like mannosyltransferase